jgi:hypothetical protein
MELEGSKWFGEPRYKLGSKVFFPFLKIVFHWFFFSFVEVELMKEWKAL